jgi:hypothetical protein
MAVWSIDVFIATILLDSLALSQAPGANESPNRSSDRVSDKAVRRPIREILRWSLAGVSAAAPLH